MSAVYRYGEAHTPCLEQGLGLSPWAHCWWNLLLIRDRNYNFCPRLSVPVALLAACGGEGRVSCILWKAHTCTLGPSCSHVLSCRTMRWRWGIKVKVIILGLFKEKCMLSRLVQIVPQRESLSHRDTTCLLSVLIFGFQSLYTWASRKQGFVFLAFFPAASAPSYLVQSTVAAWHCLGAHQDHELGISGIQLHGRLRNHSDGTLRLGCTEGQRVPLGDLLSYLDPHKYFFLTFAEKQFNKSLKNASCIHKEKSLLARFLRTASYLHYKCHKHVLESVSFIFSRWQKSGSVSCSLKHISS